MWPLDGYGVVQLVGYVMDGAEHNGTRITTALGADFSAVRSEQVVVEVEHVIG